MITGSQKQTLAAALRAETDPGVVEAVAIRNDVALHQWCNSLGTTDAWREHIPPTDLFNETPIASFDGLSAGKRDAWSLVLCMESLNATVAKFRNGIVDIWGASTANNIMAAACVEKATRGQVYLGGNSPTTGAVTALRRNYSGQLQIEDISDALNRF